MSSRRGRSSRATEERRNTEVLDPEEGKAGGRTPSQAPKTPIPKAPEKEPKSPASRQLDPVPLKVWVVASRHKWHQLAGFEARAKTQNLGPLTIPEWERAYQDFLATPVN